MAACIIAITLVHATAADRIPDRCQGCPACQLSCLFYQAHNKAASAWRHGKSDTPQSFLAHPVQCRRQYSASVRGNKTSLNSCLVQDSLTHYAMLTPLLLSVWTQTPPALYAHTPPAEQHTWDMPAPLRQPPQPVTYSMKELRASASRSSSCKLALQQQPVTSQSARTPSPQLLGAET